jgi:hypothetical protein
MCGCGLASEWFRRLEEWPEGLERLPGDGSARESGIDAGVYAHFGFGALARISSDPMVVHMDFDVF